MSNPVTPGNALSYTDIEQSYLEYQRINRENRYAVTGMVVGYIGSIASMILLGLGSKGSEKPSYMKFASISFAGLCLGGGAGYAVSRFTEKK